MNQETVTARSRKDKARISDPSLKGLGIDTVDAKGKNICSVGDTSNFEARVSLKGGDDFLGCGDGLGVTLGEALEEMERGGSEAKRGGFVLVRIRNPSPTAVRRKAERASLNQF